MKSEEPPLIDTNILVYLFDANEEAKRRISQDIVAGCFTSEMNYSVSMQNLAECAVVLTQKVTNPIPYKDVCRLIHDITSFDGWNILHYNEKTIIHALEIQNSYGIHFWDSLLVATMRESHIHTIYTEDAHFARIPGITIVNPYRTAAR